MDMNDRALRDIVIGLGGRTEGIPRESGFDITAASEVMAILCLADGIPDLKARLDRIVVGYSAAGTPVTATDVRAVGAMAALLNEAIKPNLVQTTEGVPAFVHGGPFANIAHGMQQHCRHQDGAGAGRHRGDRGRLRLRTRRREVLRHQVPLRRLYSGVHRARGDHPRAQDARRQAARGRGPA